MKIIKSLNNIDIEKVIDLYKRSFNDPLNFVDLSFKLYLKDSDFFGLIDTKNNDKLVMITFFNSKRVLYNNKKYKGCLIYSVAVDKKYQNKKIMTTYLPLFINEMKNEFDVFFIQAYNWDFYKNIETTDCNNKSKWILKKDQFLTPPDFLTKPNYILINKIYNDFIYKNKIKNFCYKTEKETKKYFKLYSELNSKIIMTKKSYAVYDFKNNEIIEYCYSDLKDFIKLVSSFKYDTKINSLISLDKRYFSLNEDFNVFTKIIKNDNFSEEIYFKDNW